MLSFLPVNVAFPSRSTHRSGCGCTPAPAIQPASRCHAADRAPACCAARPCAPPAVQLIVHQLGGEVKTADGGGEYGRMPMNVVRDSTLFSTEQEDSQLVWMSHGDEAVKLPPGFCVVARSEQVRAAFAAAAAAARCCRPGSVWWHTASRWGLAAASFW